jgi:Tfp pilus assembly protein PilF
MNDAALDPRPSEPTANLDEPPLSAPPPAATTPRKWWATLPRRIGRGFTYPFRRPWRFLAGAFGFALFALVGLWIGRAVWVDYHLRAARAEMDRYHSVHARDHLQACLTVDPLNPDALLLAARAARRLGAFHDAEQYLKRYERERGQNDEALVLERVLLEAHRGELERVSEFCGERVRAKHPDAPLVLEAVTYGFLRKFQLRDARACLQLWLDDQPENTQAHLLRGIIDELQGQTNDARDEYQRVLELDPEHEEARMRLSGVLLENHEAREALRHLECLQRGRPDDPVVAVRIAQCRVQLGQQPEAEKILDDLLARRPDYPEALAARGKLALQSGDLARAEDLLRRAVQLDPGNYSTHYQLYLCLERCNKEDETRLELSRLDQLEDDLKNIKEILDLRMDRAPNDPALRYQAGMIALRSGAVEEGVRWMESALEADPDYAPAHKVLAVYYQRVGNPSRAAKHLEKARGASDAAPPSFDPPQGDGHGPAGRDGK